MKDSAGKINWTFCVLGLAEKGWVNHTDMRYGRLATGSLAMHCIISSKSKVNSLSNRIHTSFFSYSSLFT